MDEIIVSLEIVQEKVLGFLGVQQGPSIVWLWVSLGCCLFLLLYLSVRILVGRRKRFSLSTVSNVPRAEPEGPDRMGPGIVEGEVDVETVPEERGTAPILLEEPEENLLERLRGRLAKTHDQLIGRLDQILLKSGSGQEDLLDELEEVLVTADLGVKTSYALLGEVQKEVESRSLQPEALKTALRNKLRSMLDIEAPDFEAGRAKPFVIMVVGVNGVGKTTSIGKLAALLKEQGREVMLVAADTFRAAAIEQLQIWSDRVGTDFVRHKPASDPSAVVYDAMQAAKSRETDLVIVDTAGRLHTKTNLMEELKKIKRIMTREQEGAPHEILLVVDATTGQNAITQARTFHEALGVTGIILTKLDGTAKGGVVVGIAHELGLPVRFIGIGEGVHDMRAFDPDLFLAAVFAEPGNGRLH